MQYFVKGGSIDKGMVGEQAVQQSAAGGGPDVDSVGPTTATDMDVEHPVAGGATDAWSSVGVDMGMDIEHPFSVEPPARVDAVGPGGEPAAEQGVAHVIDEIKYYIDRRIVGAHSALLALRSVPELELKPPSQSLPLHLEGRRQVRCSLARLCCRCLRSPASAVPDTRLR